MNDAVVFPLNDTDMQCARGRSSLLCGACKDGYSLVLGTSQCMQCNNTYLAFLAVMGVALVFFLLVCKLTAATGTLSGLVCNKVCLTFIMTCVFQCTMNLAVFYEVFFCFCFFKS